MYQQDLASLVGCSRVYIQKIEQTPEFGGQKISPALAKRIAHETGISAAWLLNADPTAQPVDQSSKAYTHETFVRWRSDKLKPKPYETAAIALGGLVFYGLLRSILRTAQRTGDASIAYYKISRALESIAEEFGVKTRPFVPGQSTDPAMVAAEHVESDITIILNAAKRETAKQRKSKRSSRA